MSKKLNKMTKATVSGASKTDSTPINTNSEQCTCEGCQTYAAMSVPISKQQADKNLTSFTLDLAVLRKEYHIKNLVALAEVETTETCEHGTNTQIGVIDREGDEDECNALLVNALEEIERRGERTGNGRL